MVTLKQQVQHAAEKIKTAFPAFDAPVSLIQTGTGFDSADLPDRILGTLPLSELPGMPEENSPAGHPLTISLCACDQAQFLLLRGRRHLYEGYGPAPCVIPILAARLCGIRHFILFSVCASLRDDLKPGTWVVLTDHINNLGTSPLVGNTDCSTSGYPDMSQAYSQELNSGIINVAAEQGLTPRLGVYQADLGPQFQTPAEAEAARRNGADIVGHSVVLETIAAHAAGGEAATLALVTYAAATCGGRPLDHADAVEGSRFCSPPMMRALRLHLCNAVTPNSG